MDRIKEALQGLYEAVSDPEVHIPDRLYGRVTEAAASLLTAEPEPCEDARGYARNVIKAERDDQGFSVDGIAALFDAYASRREQEVRADAFESGYIQGHNDTVESCVRDPRQAAEEYAAILQDTEPAKGSDNAIGEAIDALRVNALRHGNKELENIANRAYAELVAIRTGYPTKASEDVEMLEDSATIGEAIKNLYLWSSGHAMTTSRNRTDIGHNALLALDRIVARLKEGNRG